MPIWNNSADCRKLKAKCVDFGDNRFEISHFKEIDIRKKNIIFSLQLFFPDADCPSSSAL